MYCWHGFDGFFVARSVGSRQRVTTVERGRVACLQQTLNNKPLHQGMHFDFQSTDRNVLV